MPENRLADEPKNILHCNCKCPYWGKLHDHIWVVRCTCGKEETACGYCLEAGRVTCCFKCAAENN